MSLARARMMESVWLQAMSFHHHWYPFALELQDLSWRLRRIGFLGTLLLYSIGEAIFIDSVKMTTKKGEGIYTSIRGASKENDISTAMADTQPLYLFGDPLEAHQFAFFQAATGIKDFSQLKSHHFFILEEAYKLSPHPCIWKLNFICGKVVDHHLYPRIREVAQQRSNQQQIFVEIGAFLGPNLRQVVRDGWKRDNVFAIDVVQAWPRLGCKLFNDAKNPTPCFVGDIWNLETFDPSESNLIAADHETINLCELTTNCNPLKRRSRFIMVNALFHILGEEGQYELAKKCEALLSEKPGSAIFGMQRGEQVKGIQHFPGKKDVKLFCHSPESWNELWNQIFKPGEVKVKAYLEEKGVQIRDHTIPGSGSALFLIWSVTRT